MGWKFSLLKERELLLLMGWKLSLLQERELFLEINQVE